MFILKNWIMRKNKGVSGKVYNHPNFKNGEMITISQIVEIDEKKVKTISGSIYYLEEPDPKYIEFLNINKIPFDKENPIKFVKNLTNYKYIYKKEDKNGTN
jgi:hypothetical protein